MFVSYRASIWLLAASLSTSCLSRGDRVKREIPTDDDIAPEAVLDDGDEQREPDALETDPYGLRGVSPSHGPAEGGNSVIVQGNGFGTATGVWFGDTPATQVIAIDKTRLQVLVPSGSPGPVDLVTRLGDDDSTQRTLIGGYSYDTFTVHPSFGPTLGGTSIQLSGTGTQWSPDSVVTIDLEPCTGVNLDTEGDTQVLTCTTPKGEEGSRVVTVQTGEELDSLVGGFRYDAAPSDAEGGFAGQPLTDEVTVWVRDGFFGEPIEGARVFSDDAATLETAETTGEDGRAVLASDADSPPTITIAARCFQPQTFVAVPVDTLTAFLDPVLSPDCLPPSGDLPSLGGSSVPPYFTVNGELVWGMGVEFRRGPWDNVPLPRGDDEFQVAYVFELSANPDAPLVLPSRSRAVTPDSSGSLGYGYSFDTRTKGNLTLYALAGIENRSGNQRRFTPYAMGVVQGVPASDEDFHPNIAMSMVLDQTLTLDLTWPAQDDLGRDRLQTHLWLRLGRSGYVILPSNTPDTFPTSRIAYVGVPPLTGILKDASYGLRLLSVSGSAGDLPWSGLEHHFNAGTERDSAYPLAVPVAVTPEANTSWDGQHVAVQIPDASPTPDLLRIQIADSVGLVRWNVYAPGDTVAVALPALGHLDEVHAPKGQLQFLIAHGQLRNFSYSNLRERDYLPETWSAYAVSSVQAHMY